MKKLVLIFLFFSYVIATEINYGDIKEKIEIVRVYDGDTFYINVPSWPDIIGKEIAIRIYGIDTPELRTKNEKEKNLGYLAKQKVEEIFKKATVIQLKNCMRGKYFRIVAEVWVDGINLSEYLIEQGLAYKYDGGTKDAPW